MGFQKIPFLPQKERHKSKPDLLHDIICMANNPSNHDGLIIIGVDEETDYSICDKKFKYYKPGLFLASVDSLPFVTLFVIGIIVT